MAERKRLGDSPEDSAPYVNVARNLLAQLKQAMRLNNLLVLSRTIDLSDDVRITVSSAFGQDEINIDTSRQQTAAARAEAESTKTDDSELLSGTLFDTATVTGSVSLTFTTTTQQPPPPPPPALPSLYIAGYKVKSSLGQNYFVPFVWNDVDGYRELGTWFNEFQGAITVISKTANWVGGWVEIAGPGGTGAQKLQQAARWSSDGTSGKGYRAKPPNGLNSSVVKSLNSGGTNVAVDCWFQGGQVFTGATTPGHWDGQDNSVIALGAVSNDSISTTAFDGLWASNNKYQVDGGAWITYGGTDLIATCVTRIRRAAVPPPVAPPPVVTTTTLVFSG